MKKYIVLTVLLLSAGLILVGNRQQVESAPPIPLAAEPPVTGSKQPMQEALKTEVLSGFSKPVREMEREIQTRFSEYNEVYSKYLSLREQFVAKIQMAKGHNSSELEALSAELDQVLLSLKTASAQIAEQTGLLNNSILAEYSQKKKEKKL